MGALAAVRRAAVLSLAIVGAPAASVAEEGPAPAKIVCLNAADTRDTVKTRKLLEPFIAIKYAATQKKAEALSAKLCHIGDEFFYEIILLHHDGRLVRVQVDAEATKPMLRVTHESVGRDRLPE
jgi:hypothetical protein